MWISTQSSIRCGGTRLGNSVDTMKPVQNQNFSGNRKELAKVLGADVGQPKNHQHGQFPWNLANLVKTFPGIIVRQHLTDRKQMGLLREQCAELRKGLCGAVPIWSGWKMVGVLPWHATVISETYKISCLLGRHPHERRFGQPFKGPIIPFGAVVEYHTVCAKDLSRLHQFGKKVMPGIFLGFALHAGGRDLERSHFRRRRPWMVKKSFSPVADGTVKLSGKDQVLRTSTLIRDRPDRGEEQGNLLGASDGSSPTPFRDSSLHDGEARSYFWSISGNFIHRHHVEPRVKLYLPREASFPIPLKYIDVTRAARTSLDKMLDKISTIIGTFMEVENCHIRGHVSLGLLFWVREHRMEKHGPGRRLTRKQTTSRPHLLWPEIWKDMSEALKRRENQKWAIEKPKLDNARKLRGIYFFDPADEEF